MFKYKPFESMIGQAEKILPDSEFNKQLDAEMKFLTDYYNGEDRSVINPLLCLYIHDHASKNMNRVVEMLNDDIGFGWNDLDRLSKREEGKTMISIFSIMVNALPDQPPYLALAGRTIDGRTNNGVFVIKHTFDKKGIRLDLPCRPCYYERGCKSHQVEQTNLNRLFSAYLQE